MLQFPLLLVLVNSAVVPDNPVVPDIPDVQDVPDVPDIPVDPDTPIPDSDVQVPSEPSTWNGIPGNISEQ